MTSGRVLIVFGALLLVIGIYYRFVRIPGLRRKKTRRTAAVKGVITNVKTYSRKNSPTGYECDFSYNVGGKDYAINNVRAYIPHDKGEPVNVLYDPQKPDDAHVDGFFSDPEDGKKAAVFFIIAGAVSIAGGIISTLLQA